MSLLLSVVQYIPRTRRAPYEMPSTCLVRPRGLKSVAAIIACAGPRLLNPAKDELEDVADHRPLSTQSGYSSKVNECPLYGELLPFCSRGELPLSEMKSSLAQ